MSSSPIQFTSKGTWDTTSKWLEKMQDADMFKSLSQYGSMGVDALANATPIDSGLAADSWSYQIEQRKGYFSIQWYNTDVDDQGQPIVILLQYGHGTRNGGYVQGQDFINQTMQPIFDQIESAVWKVVNG